MPNYHEVDLNYKFTLTDFENVESPVTVDADVCLAEVIKELRISYKI